MTNNDSVFSSGAVQGYLLLLLACGAGLLFSIPTGARVSDLLDLRWNPSPLVFYLTYVTLFGLFGTFRGIAATRWDHRGWGTVLRIAGHVLFGQLLLLPYLLFSRSLLAGRDLVLPLFALYTTCASIMFSLIAYRLELWGTTRRTHTFLLQYTLFALVLILPWAIGLISQVPTVLTLLSPIGAALRIVQDASAAEVALAFVFVAAIACSLLVAIRRTVRRIHAF